MGKKKRWNELTRAQRIGVVISSVLQVVLLAAALWDIRHRSAEEINGPRRLWAAVVFVNFVGPIAYFVFGRRRSPGGDGRLGLSPMHLRRLPRGA